MCNHLLDRAQRRVGQSKSVPDAVIERFEHNDFNQSGPPNGEAAKVRRVRCSLAKTVQQGEARRRATISGGHHPSAPPRDPAPSRAAATFGGVLASQAEFLECLPDVVELFAEW